MAERTSRQHKHDLANPPRQSPPPKVHRGPARPIMLLVGAAVLFTILVAVVLNIDTGHGDRAQQDDADDIIELITPGVLDRDKLDQRDDQLRPDMRPQLSQGGVIEIADQNTQELAQRYRFDSLDPNPEGAAPGWLRMTRPRIELFLENDRVVTISGDSALAYRPHRAIESGTMTGNVVVRLYESEPGGEVNYAADRPTWVVTTDEATLDNFLGEIRCDGHVLIESESMTLPGRQLQLLVDDQHNRVELRIKHPEYIRLVSTRASDASRQVHASAAAPQSRPASHQRTSTHASQRSPRVIPVSSQFEPAQRRSSQFYLLTISDDVIIRQGDLESRRTALGDRLEIVFSTESEGFDGALALGSPHSRSAAANAPQIAGPRPLHDLVASLALASYDERDTDEHLLGPDITLIRCRGPLTIVPLDDSTRQLASPQDMRLELTGSPVRLTDATNQTEATGSIFSYHTEDELIELAGSVEHPLHVNTPDMRAGGEVFRLSQATGRGGFEGAGWMTRYTAMAVSSEPPSQAGPVQTELQITWQRGMNLTFSEGGGGRLKSARFDGDVNVSTDDFIMDADEMIVGFTDDMDASGELDANSINSIHAMRSVRVLGVTDHGSIKCEDLQLDLTRTSIGSTIPQLMVAVGDVEAIDDDQIIWSDSLRVSFLEDENAEAKVRELLAEQDVQVLLADGTRAFADRLVGDGVSETVELTGDDVAIISDKMVMERGKHIVLERGAGTASAPGPGSLRLFSQPILEPNRQRITRPVITEADGNVELRANWKQSMVYDSTVNDGAGSVDFRGDVDVLSNPTPLERNTMTGDALTIEFQRVEQGEADGSVDQPAADLRSGERDVARLIARLNAKLESQTFTSPDRDGEPNIFYIAGDYVEYDARTTEAHVAGAGELLIHDITPQREGAVTSSTPFGTKGSTMMRWNRELRMTRAVDDLYEIVSRGEVELRHRSLDGVISTMTCQRLEAMVRRPDNTETRRGSGGLDMGGSAEFERVKGTGGVVIVTDQRTVDCDSFDYDVASGIARITAEPGNVVSIQTAGSPNVVNAQEAIWNMERDSIRIIRAAGVSGN